jgi:hypothetical protein
MDYQAQQHDQLAAVYLHQLQGLVCEISVAMDAVAANALSRFQESVAKQERLCFDLVQMANAVGQGYPSVRDASQGNVEPAVDREIQLASEALCRVNLSYAALLQHSGRSIALLASLCRNHLGQSEEVRGSRWKRQTWSCEM